MDRADELLGALPDSLPTNRSAAEAALRIAERAAGLPRGERPPVVALNGAQGSGKSTIARLAAEALDRFHGLRPALLSLDDFYLGKAARQKLAREVHPLCVTRGVPGTHDVALMRRTLDGLAAAAQDGSTPLPAFDKLGDDRRPEEQWVTFDGRPELILFEGWCVGLKADDVPPWAGPINPLEAAEDPRGEWFAWSLGVMRDDYQPIWDQIALLVSIEVPDVATVIDSRLRQEKSLPTDCARKRMNRAQVTRFVEHYERHTSALWAAMPARADMLFRRTGDFDYALIE